MNNITPTLFVIAFTAWFVCLCKVEGRSSDREAWWGRVGGAKVEWEDETGGLLMKKMRLGAFVQAPEYGR